MKLQNMSQVLKIQTPHLAGSEILKYPQTKECEIIFNRIDCVQNPQTLIQLAKRFCIVLLSSDQTKFSGHITGMNIEGAG